MKGLGIASQLSKPKKNFFRAALHCCNLLILPFIFFLTIYLLKLYKLNLHKDLGSNSFCQQQISAYRSQTNLKTPWDDFGASFTGKKFEYSKLDYDVCTRHRFENVIIYHVEGFPHYFAKILLKEYSDITRPFLVKSNPSFPTRKKSEFGVDIGDLEKFVAFERTIQNIGKSEINNYKSLASGNAIYQKNRFVLYLESYFKCFGDDELQYFQQYDNIFSQFKGAHKNLIGYINKHNL